MNKKKRQEALEIAKDLVKAAKSSTDFHNAFFGVGGSFGELFPERAEREAFLKTPEYREISQMRADLIQLEIAWHDLSLYLNGARAGYELGPVGYIFLTPDQVLDEFLRVFPKHKKWRARLLEILTAAENAHNIENEMIRVPKACPLASAI